MDALEHFPFFGPRTFGVSPEVYYWALLPVMIFVARIFDVSMDTVRIIYVNRGRKYLAPTIGFFQVLIWVSVISAIMSNLTHPHLVLAYAGGYAAGNWIGMLIEEKLSVGLVAVRVITSDDATKLINRLHSERVGVTSMAARGVSGQVRLLFSVIPRKSLESVQAIIRQHHPEAFISVQDVRSVSEGTFPRRRDREADNPMRNHH